MKVSALTWGRSATLELRRRDERSFPGKRRPGEELGLAWREDGWRVQIGGRSWPVVGVDALADDVLAQLASRRLPRVAWILQAVVASDGATRSLLVELREFPSVFEWPAPTQVGIDDELAEKLGRRLRLRTIDEITRWLADTLVLPPAPNDERPRVVLAGQPSNASEQGLAFRLLGDGYVADVRDDGDGLLTVSRVVQYTPRGGEPHLLRLAFGTLSFCDARVATRCRPLARTELHALVARADSYMQLWRGYGELERRRVLANARALGWLRYSSSERRDEGWSFTLDRPPGDLRAMLARFGDQAIEAAEQLPVVLREHAHPSTPIERGPRRFSGVAVPELRHHGAQVELLLAPRGESPPPPPESGFLYFCLVGDYKRLERRSRAWEQIATCENPLPQLGMLLEGRAPPTRLRHDCEPLSSAVREVIERPNDQQREALRMALQTPDLVLIQGPPGTGKTRVIAALQARLAELEEGTAIDSFSGNTLLTSFQHDAVETVASATKVLGLPAVKVGSRSGQSEVSDGVDHWRRATMAHIDERSGTTASDDVELVRIVRQRVLAALRAPADDDELPRVAREIAELVGPWIPEAESAALVELTRPPRRAHASRMANTDAVAAATALDLDHARMFEDGPRRAYDLQQALDELDGFELREVERALLDELIDWCEPSSSPRAEALVSELEQLRADIIARLTQSSDDDAPLQRRAKLEAALVRVHEHLVERLATREYGVADAVAQWRTALELDPDGVRDMLRHYTMSLAATCQQAASAGMRKAKGADPRTVGFRTVIVDEAARANPLDLMIPMAMATRRFILVGDHRQLPHVLDPDLESEFEELDKEHTRELLSQSLFHRLFELLPTLPGPRRVITLRQQYRMHPALGQFVSQTFYAPHDEGFESPRPAGEFDHDVHLAEGRALAGRAIAWFDVPGVRGRERRTQDRSVVRPCEAEIVAREAAAIVRANPTLSVGVIAFYGAQREAILECLDERGIADRDPDGRLRVHPQWSEYGGHERLRVGTVDAFQGREFDVVLLSLTRSNTPGRSGDDEKELRGRYGFLTRENRLCVAFSRQRCLLIVFGDAAMVTGPVAARAVPALVALRELCETSEYGEVIHD